MLTQMLVCDFESSDKNVGDRHHSASTKSLLWPARATTRISHAAPRHPLAVPVGWGFLRGVGVTKRSTA